MEYNKTTSNEIEFIITDDKPFPSDLADLLIYALRQKENISVPDNAVFEITRSGWDNGSLLTIKWSVKE